MYRLSGYFMLLIALVLAACTSEATAPSYEQEIMQERLEKDMRMRDRDRSVLTRQARENFSGLRYFDIDERYRFEVPFEREDSPEQVWMAQRVGEPTEHTRVGFVTIPFPEGEERLAVFRPGGSSAPDGEFWIPFADATTGEETYAAGRYLDVVVEGDTAIVDFNRAYNPLCEYNPDAYNCTLPPPENRLSIAIEAGEKISLINS